MKASKFLKEEEEAIDLVLYLKKETTITTTKIEILD